VYHISTLVVCCIALVGTVVALIYTWREYQALRGALLAGKYRETIGTVSGLIAEGRDGHPRESFRVNGIRFEYSSSDVTSGYRWTVGRGGPLREGMAVRIADVDGRIVRIETQPASQNQAR
jgi:hypothetical protein